VERRVEERGFSRAGANPIRRRKRADGRLPKRSPPFSLTSLFQEGERSAAQALISNCLRLISLIAVNLPRGSTVEGAAG